MADTDTHQYPEPTTPPAGTTPSPPAQTESARHRLLDLVGLASLLSLCAGVYLAVGNAGFSVIIGAAVGLFGTWRIRR